MPSTANSRRKLARRGREIPGSSKSLQKALRILLHLGQNGPEQGLMQLSSALSLNKTTVYRLLRAMEKFELIEKSPESERYRLGLKLHELGTRAMESRTFQSEARRFLVELSRRTHESVSLAAPGSGGVICIDRVDSASSIIHIRTLVGARFAAHATAIGKAVLAFIPKEEVREILERAGLPRFTPSTFIRIASLKENLRLIRRRGYSLDEQELERGLSGVAVPVLLRDGRLLAAVGIAGPTQRFQGKELALKIALARETAAEIVEALGEHGDWLRAH